MSRGIYPIILKTELLLGDLFVIKL